MDSSNFDIDKAYELLKYSYSIPEEYKEAIVSAIVKLSTKNLSIETARKFVDKEQNLFNQFGILSCHENNFNGFTAEWLVCMEYNGLKNKGDLLLTIVNPDPQSKADLLHIIKTENGIIVRPGPDVKSGSEDYIINEYERNLKSKYEIPFLDFSGILTTEDGIRRLSPRKKNRVNELFENYPHKRPIPSSVDYQTARTILTKMIHEFDIEMGLEKNKLSKEKVEQVKKYHQKEINERATKSWDEFASKSKDVYSGVKNETDSDFTAPLKEKSPDMDDSIPIKPIKKTEKEKKKKKKEKKEKKEKLKREKDNEFFEKVRNRVYKTGKFIDEHPIIKTALIVGSEVIVNVVIDSISKNSNRKKYERSIKSENYDFDESNSYIDDSSTDNFDYEPRLSPKEHDVSPHRQTYHTKEGPIFKDKAPYHRGSKKE